MCLFLLQVPEVVAWEEEVYEDEDDENEEANWRNEYPDEEDSDVGSDAEERYGGVHLLHAPSFFFSLKKKKNLR